MLLVVLETSEIFRLGLVTFLREQPDMEVVGAPQISD